MASSAGSLSSSTASFFEQVSVMKPGSTCIVGSASTGLPLGLLAADYLLMRALQSSRFTKVICINLDRRDTSLLSLAKFVGKCDKLVILKSTVDELLHFTVKKLLDDLETSECCAIFIFSLSEIIVEFGHMEVSRLLNTLSSAEIDGDSSTLKSKVHCTIGVIHETLHDIPSLHYIQSLFSTVSIVSSNDGTISNAVLGQIHSVRKSPNTGKFYESTEFFTHANGVLCPIPSMKDLSNHRYSDLDNSASTGNDSLHPPRSVVSVLESVAVVKETKPITVASTKPIVDNYADKRLIAFDSTDPEFDEDSDPDNDLDL